jgi:hypothetical protein
MIYTSEMIYFLTGWHFTIFYRYLSKILHLKVLMMGVLGKKSTAN